MKYRTIWTICTAENLKNACNSQEAKASYDVRKAEYLARGWDVTGHDDSALMGAAKDVKMKKRVESDEGFGAWYFDSERGEMSSSYAYVRLRHQNDYKKKGLRKGQDCRRTLGEIAWIASDVRGAL